jgi:hypothetical protein
MRRRHTDGQPLYSRYEPETLSKDVKKIKDRSNKKKKYEADSDYRKIARIRARNWYFANKNRANKKSRQKYEEVHRETRLVRTYGITVAQYDAILIHQNGVCAICQNPPKTRRLHVDHDHKSGRVRGLLCFRCNRILVANHSVQTVKKVLAYLEREFDGRNLSPHSSTTLLTAEGAT